MTRKINVRGKKAVFPFLILLLFSSPLMATSWDSGHHELVDGNSYGEVRIYNDVILDIYGGGISYVFAYDNTLTNWYDGEMGYFVTDNNSTANIYGGVLDIGLGAAGNSIVNLYAHDVIITDIGGYWDTGQLTGKYNLNNQQFTFDLWGSDTYTHIITIPEPTTFLLLLSGILLFRRRRLKY
jgi:hypothetical protein